jgi:hypothetical protein
MFADLHVVTAVSNPERYQSRYRLYRDFEKRCLDAGAKLHTVEVAFGDRPHEVTTADHPCHTQLRTKSQIWHKENLLNIGISRLPKDWKYVAWVDCDVAFARPDWVAETIHQLQHYHVVQMFSHLQELTPSFGPTPTYYPGVPASWAYCYEFDLPGTKRHRGYGATSVDGEIGYYWHPGFAWAARREAIDHLGGLMDHMIVGGADYLMAICLTNRLPLPKWVHQGTAGRWILDWKARADKYIQGNVGHVPGLLLHHWHGKKAQRQYTSRWNIVLGNDYDPEKDLKRDWQGLWQLTDHNPKLRDQIRQFFRARNEDSIDVI